MKHKNVIFLFIFLAFSTWILAQEENVSPSPENTVFFVDLDGVVSDETINPLNFLGALWLLVEHPTLPLNYWEIVKKRKELAQKQVDGATNVIFNILKWLEEEKKYTNMTKWTEPLTTAYVCPAPKKETLEIIKKLKEKGFTVLFATNQDAIQFSLYRTRMLEQGHNLEEFFDGGISTLAYNHQDSCTFQHNTPDAWHAIPHIKPQQQYFETLKKLLLIHKPHCAQRKNCKLIFIDDIELHADTAKKEGIHGLRFKSADQLKKDLEDFGIKLADKN